jgi:hypothetical protein
VLLFEPELHLGDQALARRKHTKRSKIRAMERAIVR